MRTDFFESVLCALCASAVKIRSFLAGSTRSMLQRRRAYDLKGARGARGNQPSLFQLQKKSLHRRLPAFRLQPFLDHGRRAARRRSLPEDGERPPQLADLLLAGSIVEIACETPGIEAEKVVDLLQQPEDLFFSRWGRKLAPSFRAVDSGWHAFVAHRACAGSSCPPCKAPAPDHARECEHGSACR